MSGSKRKIKTAKDIKRFVDDYDIYWKQLVEHFDPRNALETVKFSDMFVMALYESLYARVMQLYPKDDREIITISLSRLKVLLHDLPEPKHARSIAEKMNGTFGLSHYYFLKGCIVGEDIVKKRLIAERKQRIQDMIKPIKGRRRLRIGRKEDSK